MPQELILATLLIGLIAILWAIRWAVTDSQKSLGHPLEQGRPGTAQSLGIPRTRDK